MRNLLGAFSVVLVAVGCGSSRSGFDDTSSSGGTSSSSGDPSTFGNDGGSSDGGGITSTTSIIYANTDDSLYTLDPSTNALTLVGKFSGGDGNVTDCAVNAAGDLYVNTGDAIYRASLPTSGTGSVALSKVATIAAAKSGQQFYGLAFAPAGVLGPGEGLVGGDGDGMLWAIDPSTGKLHQLGSFGADTGGAFFALSGDVVFYQDGSGNPTGLATIRSCKGSSCSTQNDYLAGIDMNALAAAFTSGTPAATLLSGIYGGSGGGKGAGTGHGELFGLGAWEGKVFGFERASANGGVPALVSIDTTSGAGTIVPSTLKFSNGWSGACVTTKVTVTVPPPPH